MEPRTVLNPRLRAAALALLAVAAVALVALGGRQARSGNLGLKENDPMLSGLRPQNPTLDPAALAARPPLDASQPQVFETASFALG